MRQPLSVGFWFSLGHSTIVFGLAFLLSVGVKALAGPVEDDNSTLHSVTGEIGASVSGVFLWILGILNLVVLLGIIKVFREMRQGRYDEQELEDQLNKRGFMNRFLNGMTKSVRKPWHIYPIGVLFGLGFDTATEVGLLVLAGGAAAFNLPFYSILVLPILFAAGMCVMDTTDGVFMNAAYGWAFAKPVRKVFYNITITSISVAVALIIGTIELIGVFADQANITSGPIASDRQHRPRLRRLRDRRRCSSSPGSSPCSSGATAASNRNGQPLSRPPRPTRPPSVDDGARSGRGASRQVFPQDGDEHDRGQDVHRGAPETDRVHLVELDEEQIEHHHQTQRTHRPGARSRDHGAGTGRPTTRPSPRSRRGRVPPPARRRSWTICWW